MSEYRSDPLWRADQLSPITEVLREAASDPEKIDTIYDRFVALVGQHIPAETSEAHGRIIGRSLAFELFWVAGIRSPVEVDSDERTRARIATSLSQYQRGTDAISPLASKVAVDELLFDGRHHASEPEISRGCGLLFAEMRRRFPPGDIIIY